MSHSEEEALNGNKKICAAANTDEVINDLPAALSKSPICSTISLASVNIVPIDWRTKHDNDNTSNDDKQLK
jgi:hypothetical protein